MIDLHTHTNYSDGTWNLKKLLEEAEKANIEVLSITDHNTVNGYKELEKINVKEIFKGNIMTGVEFSTVFDGVMFHLLAYDFELKKLNKFIFDNYENKKLNLKKEFNYMIESCKKNNIKIGTLEYEEHKGWPIDIIFPEIKKYEENKKYFKNEEWENIDVFYNSCVTNKKFPVFVDFSIHYPNANIVADAVRNADGKLFVAHVFKYHLEDSISFLDILKQNYIIDGVEVYHSSFSEEQIEILEKYCKKNNLLMSGGSDCHGEKKQNRKIGKGYGNLNINKEILNNWYNICV
jgi:PHP C-terminal domain protein